MLFVVHAVAWPPAFSVTVGIAVLDPHAPTFAFTVGRVTTPVPLTLIAPDIWPYTNAPTCVAVHL